MNAKITSFRSKYRSFCDFCDGYPSFDMLSILGIKDFLRLQCVRFKISVLCVATPRRDLHAFKPRLHERFFACDGDAIFLKIVASPARGENRMCSHPRTGDATDEKIAEKKSREIQ